MNRPLGPNSEESEKSEGNIVGTGSVIIAIVFIVGLCLLLTTLNNRDDEATRPRATSRPAATSTPASFDVSYKVTGTGRTADLTYRNESEATEQKEVTLPWFLNFEAEDGQFLYVAAQSTFDGSADITCEITVNGKVLQSAESNGRFVIASCSGSVGD